MSKKITLEDLAVMVQTGFEETEKRLKTELEVMMEGKITHSFTSLTTSLRKEMRVGFDQVNRRFDALEEIVHKQNREWKILNEHRMLTDARLSHLEAAT